VQAGSTTTRVSGELRPEGREEDCKRRDKEDSDDKAKDGGVSD